MPLPLFCPHVDNNHQPCKPYPYIHYRYICSSIIAQASDLTQKIDALFTRCFQDVVVEIEVPSPDRTEVGADSGTQPQQQQQQQNEGAKEPKATTTTTTREERFPQLTEAQFGELGRSRPEVMQALLAAKEKSDPLGWKGFQAEVSMLKLQRTRVEREAQEVRGGGREWRGRVYILVPRPYILWETFLDPL